MNQEYLKQLKEQKEKLKKLKEENQAEASNPIGKDAAKTKRLLNGSIKAWEEPVSTKNGFVSAVLLGLISFIMELLFIGISMLIIK